MWTKNAVGSLSLGDTGAGRRPVIVPTRRRLDSRFPSLGFTISTDLPWVEVLVTTDPTLFDPARSAARTPATFYASRTDGGLTATTSGRARYVVPAGVVRRLSGSASLWYLAVGYPDATGTNGVASAATGASGIVTVDKSLQGPVRSVGHTGARRGLSFSRGLGETDASDRLDGEDGADIPRDLLTSASLSSNGIDDRMEGEDGADLVWPPVATPTPPLPPPPAPPAASPAPAPAPPAAPAPAAPAADPAAMAAALLDYDDGWDSLPAGRASALGAVAELSDEYPDIDWGDVDLDDRGYGKPPAYQSLDVAPAEVPAPPPPAAAAPLTAQPNFDLSAEIQRVIIEQTVGSDGSAYGAINADGPFRGRHGPGHKAFQRYHTGLSFGIAEFNQDSGTLGQLLKLMHEREPDTFTAAFGESARELLDITTAPGPSSEHVEGGRGPRVQPVAGADLWEEPWLTRFRNSGAIPAFRAAQNQLAAQLYLAPMLPVAAGFGLNTQRALCIVLDRAIALGEQGAKRWLADTIGPVKTPAMRHDALAALGFDSIEGFQASVAGLLTDGEFGPLTHAALTAALRLSGRSPLPLPDAATSIAQMAQRAQNEEQSARLVRLAATPDISDAPVGG